MMWYQVMIQDTNGVTGTVYVAADELEAFKAKHHVISVVAQLRVVGHLYTDNIKQRTTNGKLFPPL